MTVKRNLAVVLIIVIVVGGLVLAMKKQAPRKPPPTTQQIWESNGFPVQTAVIKRGDMEQTVEVTGDLNALDKVTLSAKIAGRVAQVNAREGDRVPRGQTIVVLDQQDLLSNLISARGGLKPRLPGFRRQRRTRLSRRSRPMPLSSKPRLNWKSAKARLRS